MVKRILLSALLVLFITNLVYLKDAPVKVNKEAKAHLEKGLKFYENKQFDQAISEFNQAISIDFNYAEAYECLGDAYKDKADKSFFFTSEVDEWHRRASQAYDRAINLGTDTGLIYQKRGKVNGHLGKTELALKDFDISIEKFNQAIKHEPKNSENYLNRAIANYYKIWTCNQDVAFRDSAFADLRLAIRLNSKYVEAYRELGFICSISGKAYRDSAIVAYSKVIEYQPKDAEAYFLRGEIYQNKGNNDQAIADFSSAIDLKFDNPMVYINRAINYVDKKTNELAIKDYNSAIEINPGVGFLYRARFYKRIREYDLAIADYTKSIELNPYSLSPIDNSCSYEGRALCYFDKKEYDKAIVDFTQVVENNIYFGDVADPFPLRARAYFLNNQFDLADSDYTTCIKYEPQNPNKYCSRGDFYKNIGKFDLALQDLNKGLEIDPNHYYCTVTRGEVYTAMRNYNKAFDDLDRAIKLQPTNPCAWYYRGLVYKARMDKSNAIADFKKCIGYGGYKDAQVQLNELEKKP